MKPAAKEDGTTELQVEASSEAFNDQIKARRLPGHKRSTPSSSIGNSSPSSSPAASESFPPPLIPTVFHEEWWLDAATGGTYSIVEAASGGKTVGRLPFVTRTRHGLRGIWTPPLTHFLGPGIDDGNGSANSRFLRRLDITRELIEKLPESSWQCIRCHRGTPDAIAFQEESFKTYAQFTHEIQPGPVDCLWPQMRDKTRNVIRRAEEQFTVSELEDPDAFVRLYEEHLSSRRVRNTLDLAAAGRLVRASLERQRGRVLAARNAQGEIVAANFCAWDTQTAFYIACTRSETAGNGANSLLLWYAIQHAASNGRIFDFAGLGTRGSILHYAGFGAVIGTRFVAVRATMMGKVLARARVLFSEEHFLY